MSIQLANTRPAKIERFKVIFKGGKPVKPTASTGFMERAMGFGIVVAEAAQRIRYNFGTTGGEISGERACKRRSAKHLEFLPSLFEGRRSIQLSYGRAETSINAGMGF
jgi:hypothetical protein